MIEVKGVYKSFGSATSLADVSISFPRTGTCALLGPNGSGKSSLLSVIAGFYKPDAGDLYWSKPPVDVRLNGMSVADRVRLGIGLMFQEPRGFPEMTVEENLLMHLLPRGSDDLLAKGFVRLPHRRAAAEVASLLDLGRITRRPPLALRTLSYGQRRLVDLLGLLGRGTRIYLLDEPFAGIDPLNLDTLLTLLRGRVRVDGSLVLLVSHELTLVRDLADHVVVLDQGRVVLRGSPDEVIESDAFKRVYLG